MSGTNANLDDLQAIAAGLRGGAAKLDGTAAPPPAPQAGTPTEAIAGVMAMLTMSTAGIVEGMDAIADEVAAGRDVYDETDNDNAGKFTKLSPFHPG